MRIIGDPPPNQSTNEKKILVEVMADAGLELGWDTWCVLQKRHHNQRYPDAPFFHDFVITTETPEWNEAIAFILEDPRSSIVIHADGAQHGGMDERERDYRNDRSLAGFLPVIRFGPREIFKDARQCVKEAIYRLQCFHGEKILRSLIANWKAGDARAELVLHLSLQVAEQARLIESQELELRAYRLAHEAQKMLISEEQKRYFGACRKLAHVIMERNSLSAALRFPGLFGHLKEIDVEQAAPFPPKPLFDSGNTKD